MSHISGDSGGGGIRWNDQTQRWETDGVSGAAVPPTAPPPPVPAYAPPGPAEWSEEQGDDGEVTYTVTPPPAPLPRSRRTSALIAGATVAVVAGGVAFGVLALRDDGAGGDAGTDAASLVSPSPTATSDTGDAWPTETPSPTASSLSPTTEVPSGYALQEDTAGFTIAVPEGWERQEKDNGVFYNSPDGTSLVQIYTDTEGTLTPYESLSQTSSTLRSANKNYRELSLQETRDVPGGQAAELVYVYDRPDGTRRKVVDRAFVAEDGTQYAVLVAGPEGDWPRQRDILQVALAHFAP